MIVQDNDPALWRGFLPRLKPDDHKYDRGMAVIFGAPKMTGATRLAAMSCARIGAGLVKVIAPEGTGVVYRETLPAHIIVEDEGRQIDLADRRIGAFLLGPGWNEEDGLAHLPLLRTLVAADGAPLVLDAGAFLVLRNLEWPIGNIVVTPHDGEFSRVFADLTGDKVGRAAMAARDVNGIVVLKGADTIISTGDGAVINHADAPQLATAGTGDVLAGMIAGLLAQGMPAKEAACAAVWIHAEAGRRFGRGLVASDLPDLIPAVLQDFSR